jgi:hypothetical protein
VPQQSTLPRAPIIIIIINVNGKYIHTQLKTEPAKNGKILETVVWSLIKEEQYRNSSAMEEHVCRSSVTVELLVAVTGYLYAHNKKRGVGVCAEVGIKEGESRSHSEGKMKTCCDRSIARTRHCPESRSPANQLVPR